MTTNKRNQFLKWSQKAYGSVKWITKRKNGLETLNIFFYNNNKNAKQYLIGFYRKYC